MAAAYQLSVIREAEDEPLIIHLRPGLQMTEDQFFEFCQANDDLQIERTARGEILIMAPTGGEGSFRENIAATRLMNWAWQNRTGRAFGTTAGFRLPNGAVRAPDASWVRLDRLAKLTPRQKRKFLPLCPDFVIEILSVSVRLEKLQGKMAEYRENGARLGWLIDPQTRKVYIYRPGKRVQCLNRPKRVFGDPELPGFEMEMAEIWKPPF